MVYYDQVVSAGAYYRPPAFGQNGAPAWTDDLIVVAPYNPSPTLSGSATLDDFTTTGGTSTGVVTTLSGAATLDDFTTTGGTSVGVVSILSGAATLDDFATTGGTSTAVASSLSGAATLDDFTTTGGTSGPVVLGSLAGSMRRSYPRRYSNAPGARR